MIFRCFLLISLVFSVFITMAIPHANAFDPEAYCNKTPATFASCPKVKANYKSVLVAIHGWGGWCDKTFGSGENTLLTHLKETAHYDVDCFEYETDGQTLQTSAAQLHSRIKQLADADYTQIGFITHSMGGIVLLEMLTKDMLTDDGVALRPENDTSRLFKSGGVHFTGAQLWASPINGIRDDTRLLSSLAGYVWLSNESLADLKPGSAYLGRLKSRLAKLAELVDRLPGNDQAAYDYKLNLLQGQGDDWVVESLQRTDSWIASSGSRAKVALTKDGHLDTVANSGGEPFPVYPQQMIEDSSLLQIRFFPLIDSVFPTNTQSIGDLTVRQVRVITGGTTYIDNNFANAFGAISELFARVLKGGYPHEASTDELFADRLVKTTSKKAAEAGQSAPDQLLDFAGRFVCSDALEALDFRARGLYDFGGGKSKAGEAIVKLVDQLDAAATQVLQDKPELATRIGTCRDADDLKSRALAFQGRAVEEGHDAQRDTAISSLSRMVPESTAAALIESGVPKLLTAYVASRPSGVPEQITETIGQLVLATASKSPELRRELSAQLETLDPATNRPLFARVLNDDQLMSLKNMAAASAVFPEDTGLAAAIANYGGASGNNPTLQFEAGELVLERAAVAPGVPTHLDLDRIESINPTVARRLNLRIEELGLPQ